MWQEGNFIVYYYCTNIISPNDWQRLRNGIGITYPIFVHIASFAIIIIFNTVVSAKRPSSSVLLILLWFLSPKVIIISNIYSRLQLAALRWWIKTKGNKNQPRSAMHRPVVPNYDYKHKYELWSATACTYHVLHVKSTVCHSVIFSLLTPCCSCC